MKKPYKLHEPFNSGHIKVSNIHSLYYEESGNPKGNPVVVIHGGPGSNSKPKYRTYFNPEKWRVIMFDQRGCGKSSPFGETEENTTTGKSSGSSVLGLQRMPRKLCNICKRRDSTIHKAKSKFSGDFEFQSSQRGSAVMHTISQLHLH